MTITAVNVLCTLHLIYISNQVLQRSLSLTFWLWMLRSVYFSVPLQLMGLRRSNSLSFRACWERVRALSLHLCSISCRHIHTKEKNLKHFLYCNLRGASMLKHYQENILSGINTTALAVDIECVGLYPLVFISVHCHCFAVLDSLFSFTGKGEAVHFTHILCFLHFTGQLHLQCYTFLFYLPH